MSDSFAELALSLPTDTKWLMYVNAQIYGHCRSYLQLWEVVHSA